VGYRDYSTAKGRIVDQSGHGDFTTIGAALAAINVGDIFIRYGSYTENLTLKPNVHLCSFPGDELLPTVEIIGKLTFSAAGTTVISNIGIVTNSDYLLAVTGSNASIVLLESCFINCLNNTGIDYTCSSSSSQIKMRDCTGDVATTGISLFTSTSAGSISFIASNFTNSGSSTTASTASAGSVNMDDTTFANAFNLSGTNIFFMTNSTIDCSEINTTALTMSSSATPNYVEHSNLQSGTAPSATINGSGNVIMAIVNVNSVNGAGDAITGTGTLTAGIVTFTSTAHTITTSTVNKLTTYGGTIV